MGSNGYTTPPETPDRQFSPHITPIRLTPEASKTRGYRAAQDDRRSASLSPATYNEWFTSSSPAHPSQLHPSQSPSHLKIQAQWKAGSPMVSVSGSSFTGVGRPVMNFDNAGSRRSSLDATVTSADEVRGPHPSSVKVSCLRSW
jgi:hypothetical protein